MDSYYEDAYGGIGTMPKDELGLTKDERILLINIARKGSKASEDPISRFYEGLFRGGFIECVDYGLAVRLSFKGEAALACMNWQDEFYDAVVADAP